MAAAVIMPRQGQSVESCIITKWNKKKGDMVKVGDILFSYETDKAGFDEEAKTEGTLLKVFFNEGDDVPVLTTVCVIGSKGENIEDDIKPLQAGLNKAENNKTDETFIYQEIKTDTGRDRMNISPRARQAAERLGVDYRSINGSGPGGRIIEKDIAAIKESGRILTPPAMEEFLKSDANGIPYGTGLGGRITTADIKNLPLKDVQSQSGYAEVKLSSIRKVISKAMLNSLLTTAQLTMNTSFDATDIIAFRKKLKENKDKSGIDNITITDIILYAASRVILNHKELNAHLLDDKMLIFKNVHLGIAVDTDRGLLVPTLADANHKSLNDISKEAKILAEECLKGTIKPDLLRGASFTVTNLGTLDIESFTPVINPPQTGILGVNAIVQRVRQVKDGYEYYPAMGLSLTFDHRALDGAPAARFLKELKNYLENFSLQFAK